MRLIAFETIYINQLKRIDKYPVLEYVGDRINAPIMYNSLLERWATMFSENILKTIVDYIVDFFEAKHSSYEVTYIIGGMLLFEKLNDIHALDLSTFQGKKNDE